jgi:hypothetical protein
MTDISTAAIRRYSTYVPNFFYIGTSKAGSTWIYNLLLQHPCIYVVPGKGLHFFDNHYDRGLEWYLGHFKPSNDKVIIAEVSHGYLYSKLACERIAQLNPQASLMVCLREPVDRAFSAYLHAVKNAQFDGSFEEALEQIPSLIDRGRYATYLAPYIETFGRDKIHVAIFDNLVRNPQEFGAQILSFLGLEFLMNPDKVNQKIMPAGQPRSKALSKLKKQGSLILRQFGLSELRGRLKTSRLVRNLLFKPYTPTEKPKMNPMTQEKLRDYFCDEVFRLDSLLGLAVSKVWGYADHTNESASGGLVGLHR